MQPENSQREDQQMLTDPSHRYFRAIQAPTNPLFKEVTRSINRLVGFCNKAGGKHSRLRCLNPFPAFSGKGFLMPFFPERTDKRLTF